MFTFKPSNSIKIELSPHDKEQLSSDETIQKAFENESIVAFDVYENDSLVAFILLRDCGEGYFLWDFAVDVNFQNKGYGTRILNDLIELMKERYGALWITTTYKQGNEIARRVYEKVGFFQTDVVEENDVHEVNMILRLK